MRAPGAISVFLAVLLLGTAEAARAGTISGRVVFRGVLPVPAPIAVAKDREVCGDSVPSDALNVSPLTRGVQHAVVFLEGLTRSEDSPPPRETVLENRACRFVPRVLAVQVGAELAIVNADPVLHNLRAWLPGRRHVFNVVQPTQGQVTRRTVKRSGVMTLTCDTHVHMLGYLLAFDHPYFAVTDSDGGFSIPRVPAGTYRISAWHPGWSVISQEPEGRVVYDAPHVLSREVAVPAAGEARVVFDLGPRP